VLAGAQKQKITRYMFKRTQSLTNASLRNRPIIIKFMGLVAVKLNKAIQSELAKNPKLEPNTKAIG